MSGADDRTRHRKLLLLVFVSVMILANGATPWLNTPFLPRVPKASAAFTAVAARGSLASGTGNTNVYSVSPSADLVVGKIIIVSAVSDNEDTTSGATSFHAVTDSQNHTWTKVFEETDTDGVADDGSTTSLWWTKVRTQISTTDSITVTLGASKTDIIISVVEATIAAGNTVMTSSVTPVHSASGTTLSQTRSGLTSRQYLLFGLFGAEGEDTAKSPIANYAEQFDLVSTTAGSATANVQMHVGTRVLTGTGDTWTSSAVTFTNAIQSLTAFYEVTPTYQQSAYRLFANADSTDVGSALAATNTAATLAAPGEAFRLRTLIHSGNGLLGSSGQDFKLQFAQQSGSCDTSFSGETYADVTTSSTIAFNDNPTPTDGSDLTDNANDPAHSSDPIINQTYEESNNFTNSTAAIDTGEDGLWDFSLKDNGGNGSIYCFRVVKTDATQLTTYVVVPQITTASGTLSVDIVDGGGSSVSSPSVAFSALSSSSSCQSGTGTLGVSSQKIRVNNSTAAPAWSVSMAATSGATSNWSSGTDSYDFNDPGSSGCTDSGDADSLAGQLSTDPSVATNTPQGGCSTTGVTLGSASAYNQGTTDNITLISASGSAETNCYWDITGIDLLQKIPSFQATGTYSLQFTITVVAQ